MAIIACPSCGKNITDRMKKCPHCGTALLTEKEPLPLTKEEVKTAAKDNLIGVLMATVLTLVVYWLWSHFASISLGKFYGEIAMVAMACANTIFNVVIFALLVIEIVWLCLLPRLVNQTYQFFVYIISSVSFGVIGYIVQNFAFLHFSPLLVNGAAEVIEYGRYYSLGLGFAFPVLFGSLYLASHKRTVKKALFLQVGLSVGFLVLSVVLGLLMTVVFYMGIHGISMANLISAIVVFVLAVLTNNEFQRLITPKNLV